MLFREIIAVYCENHTEHINTLCGQNAEFSSYLTGNTYVSPTNTNQLMLFKEIIAVYCENHKQHRKMDAAKAFLGGGGNRKVLLPADFQRILKIVFRIEHYIFRTIFIFCILI
jgi:hypothetical protein